MDDAKQALNNKIPYQKQQWHKGRIANNSPETKRALPSAGVSNEEWHSQTIQRAVINNGFHFKLVSIDRVQSLCVDLKEEFKSGSYFVVGLTNNHWCNGNNKKHIKFPDWPKDGPAIDASHWYHAIAIKNGMVHDHKTKTKISSLWLKDTNQPDRNKGYMRSIHRVWRVYRCNQHGTGCKGGCDDVVADDDLVVVDAGTVADDATTSSLPTPKKKQKRTRGGGKQNINTPIDDLSNSKSIIIKLYNQSVVETAKL